MNRNKNIVFNRASGQVFLNVPPKGIGQLPGMVNHQQQQQQQNKQNKDAEFQKKLEELSKLANVNKNQMTTINQNPIVEIVPKNIYIKKDLLFGIKKTMLSDFNYLYNSSNNNDFKIGLNKNINQQNTIFDTFYLFPNITEINCKSETNFISEKKVELFRNNYDDNDIQPFPIDFIPSGINIPLKSIDSKYSKLIIKNIYWNIFQSITKENYQSNELLSLVPDTNDYVYKKIELLASIELHAQLPNISTNPVKNNKLYPYFSNKFNGNTNIMTPANTSLYTSKSFIIDSINGSNFNDITIELNGNNDINIDLSCALLAIKISVPKKSIDILKGLDKNHKILCGYIPFSQFVLNLDYELM